MKLPRAISSGDFSDPGGSRGSATSAGRALRGRRIDASLAAAGVATALASAAFATCMIASETSEPRIAGVEHFGIFGRPRTALAAARDRALNPGGAKSVVADGARFDYTPTGSVAAGATMTTAPPLPLRVVTGPDGLAWIETEGRGFLRPRTGDFLPAFGRIGKIVREENRWVIFSDTGARLESPDSRTTSNGAPAPDGVLSRGLIFRP